MSWNSSLGNAGPFEDPAEMSKLNSRQHFNWSNDSTAFSVSNLTFGIRRYICGFSPENPFPLSGFANGWAPCPVRGTIGTNTMPENAIEWKGNENRGATPTKDERMAMPFAFSTRFVLLEGVERSCDDDLSPIGRKQFQLPRWNCIESKSKISFNESKCGCDNKLAGSKLASEVNWRQLGLLLFHSRRCLTDRQSCVRLCVCKGMMFEAKVKRN